MDDDFSIQYFANDSNFDKLKGRIQDVTQLMRQQGEEIKAAYADTALTGALKQLGQIEQKQKSINQGFQAGAASNKFFDGIIQGAKGAAATLTLLSGSAKNIGQSVEKLFDTVIQSQLQAVQQSFQAQTRSLENWHTRALSSANDNAQKRMAIERRFAAEKERLQREQAIKEARIKREQAVIDKTIHLTQIAAQTAENITRYTGGLPATAPLLAQAIITGALQAAVVAAQPLPQIPRFEKGGAVKNALLKGKSHRLGGILINAQGGEYIWDIPTVQKHGDIIKAAHENRIEQLVMHKYLLPMLQSNKVMANGQLPVGSNEDSFLLRASVNNVNRTSKENAKYIADRVSAAITGSGYINSRYHA